MVGPDPPPAPPVGQPQPDEADAVADAAANGDQAQQDAAAARYEQLSTLATNFNAVASRGGGRSTRGQTFHKQR